MGSRWYGKLASWAGALVPMQRSRSRINQIPEPIARLAYEEYANQGHSSQSFDRLHQRGGFSELEVVCLLADLIERERSA